MVLVRRLPSAQQTIGGLSAFGIREAQYAQIVKPSHVARRSPEIDRSDPARRRSGRRW